MSPSPAAPWLLCWQGLLASEATSRLRKLLPQLAGGMLCALLLVLPMATRTGLGLLIAASDLGQQLAQATRLLGGQESLPAQQPGGGWRRTHGVAASAAHGLWA